MKKRFLLFTMAVIFIAGGIPPARAQLQARLDSLRGTLRHTGVDTVRVIILDRMANACWGSSPREGIGYGMQALAIARKAGWKPGIAESYNSIGSCYRYAAVYDTAAVYFEQAMAINNEIGNRQGTAQNLGNIGILYYLQSNYPRSLDYLFRALKIFEDIGDKEGIVTQLGNIGSIYEEQKNYPAALKYDTLALKQYIAIGDREGQAIQLGNIGVVYDDMAQHRLAVRYDLAAMHIYEALDNKEGIARNLSNLSEAYAKLGDIQTSYACLQRARKLYEETGDDHGLASAYLNLGMFYLSRIKDTLRKSPVAGVPADKNACYQLAIDYDKKAIILDSAVGDFVSLAAGYKTIGEVYQWAGDYKSALTSFNQYKRYNDSVFSVENNVRIAALETQRALELKDKQIELDRLAVAKKRNERGFFFTGLGLLTAVIVIVFRNYRVQKTLNGALSVEKKRVEQRTEALDATNRELNITLINLQETQQQLIVSEKQKEAALIRGRISQDIHDDISSELTRISWVSELAKAKLKKDDYAAVPGLLDRLTDSSRDTVMKLGEIIWAVNPQHDTLASLLAFMRTHITRFFADTAFRYTIDFPGDGTDVPIHPELKRNLYLVMKEALNNAAKYSGAQQVHISLHLDGDAYVLCIDDDGRGIAPGVVQGGGNGLSNMRRRMESVQGACVITSAPEAGARVCCTGQLY